MWFKSPSVGLLPWGPELTNTGVREGLYEEVTPILSPRGRKFLGKVRSTLKGPVEEKSLVSSRNPDRKRQARAAWEGEWRTRGALIHRVSEGARFSPQCRAKLLKSFNQRRDMIQLSLEDT